MTSNLEQASDVALLEADAVAAARRGTAGGTFGIKRSEFDDFSFDVITSAFADALAMIGATGLRRFAAATEGEIAEAELDDVTGGGGVAIADMLSKLWQSKVDNMNAAVLRT
jgi:hypothetical protein